MSTLAKALCAMALGFTLFGTAQAADLAPVPAEPPPPVLTEGWRFQLTLYGWATAMDGDVGVRGLPPSDVNLSFADVLGDLDGALMSSLLATDGRWMLLADVILAKVSDSVNVGPFGGVVDFEQTQAILSGAVGYTLPLGIPNLQVGPTVGLRYNYLKAEIDFNPALLPGNFSTEGSKSWIDPTIGFALRYNFNERWFLNALGDVGGFGVGSDFTAQGFATIGYNWTETISTAVGYRVLYTDYEDGGFVYDMTQHGPFASIGIHF
jgi:hypothetical protein